MNRQQLKRFQKRQAKIIRDGERSRGYNVHSPRHKKQSSVLEEVGTLLVLALLIFTLLFI